MNLSFTASTLRASRNFRLGLRPQEPRVVDVIETDTALHMGGTVVLGHGYEGWPFVILDINKMTGPYQPVPSSGIDLDDLSLLNQNIVELITRTPRQLY